MFEPADKYMRVLTAAEELLNRTPLKDLQLQLDERVFWQTHRGTVVRASAVNTVTRNEAGQLHLSLRRWPEVQAVGRFYAQRFKAMQPPKLWPFEYAGATRPARCSM